MTSFRYLLAASTAVALLATASNAHATAYAYGNINFTNLSLSGLTASGVTVNSANVSTRDSAGYPGFAAASNPGSANNSTNPLSAGSSVPQATSGPGPFPGEDVYTQALLNSVGTRGDAQLTGNLLTGVGTGANDVAEGRIITPGTASSTAGTSTGFNVIVTTTGTQTFTLAFSASDSVIATTTNPGEFASSQVNASFLATQIINGSSGPQVGAFAPLSLNTNTSSTGGGGNGNVTNASSPYSYSVTLGAGTYQFSLLSGAQEQVTAAAPAAVPEPASMALLGVGLAGIGLIRRRRA